MKSYEVPIVYRGLSQPLFPPSLDLQQSTMTHLTCGYTAATVQV